MCGMLFSIKSFVTKMSPLDTKEGFLYYKTSKYMLHYLETPSGVKFVLNTDVNAQGVRDLLQQIYSQVCHKTTRKFQNFFDKLVIMRDIYVILFFIQF